MNLTTAETSNLDVMGDSEGLPTRDELLAASLRD